MGSLESEPPGEPRFAGRLTLQYTVVGTDLLHFQAAGDFKFFDALAQRRAGDAQ